jgi:hypothetical protein
MSNYHSERDGISIHCKVNEHCWTSLLKLSPHNTKKQFDTFETAIKNDFKAI